MNRFVPLRYDVFKGFVMRLRKKLGLKHASALDAVAKACGFKGFHEVCAMHRELLMRKQETMTARRKAKR